MSDASRRHIVPSVSVILFYHPDCPFSQAFMPHFVFLRSFLPYFVGRFDVTESELSAHAVSELSLAGFPTVIVFKDNAIVKRYPGISYVLTVVLC
jgi:hypothetical protein